MVTQSLPGAAPETQPVPVRGLVDRFCREPRREAGVCCSQENGGEQAFLARAGTRVGGGVLEGGSQAPGLTGCVLLGTGLCPLLPVCQLTGAVGFPVDTLDPAGTE